MRIFTRSLPLLYQRVNEKFPWPAEHSVGIKLSFDHLYGIMVHVSGFGGQEFGVLTVKVMLFNG